MDWPPTSSTAKVNYPQRLALFVTCLGTLMMALDTTIVNIALAPIRTELNISEPLLVWVMNGYMVPCAGLLILCGRWGDQYGHRRIFVASIVLFTLASVACGMARDAAFLIGARVVQGTGAAAVLAVTFPLIMRLSADPAQRAQGMAIYSCVASCGSSAGLLLSGTLISALSWRWIFLINLPVGVLICALSRALPPDRVGQQHFRALDIGGAVTITISLTCAIAAILNAAALAWTSLWVLLPLCTSMLTFLLFLRIETHVRFPIISLTLLGSRNIRLGAIAMALWAAAQNGWFFIASLDLAELLQHNSLKVGLAFLPATVFAAAFSVGLTATFIVRFGKKRPMITGLLCAATGFALLAAAPLADAHFSRDILPGMLLVGLGAGIATAPLALCALSSVTESDYGIASGVTNTSRMMGAALGLAIIGGIAATRSNHLLRVGATLPIALKSGFSTGYAIAAVLATTAALFGRHVDE